MTQEELILSRLEQRNPYTMLVLHDTDPDGTRVAGKNPALMEGDDFLDSEAMAIEMPEVRQ